MSAQLQAGMKAQSGTRGRGQGAKELKGDSKIMILDTQCVSLVGPRQSRPSGAVELNQGQATLFQSIFKDIYPVSHIRGFGQPVVVLV